MPRLGGIWASARQQAHGPEQRVALSWVHLTGEGKAKMKPKKCLYFTLKLFFKAFLKSGTIIVGKKKMLEVLTFKLFISFFK